MSSQPAEPAGGYRWPPQPILDVEEAARILAERLGEAYDDLEAQRLRLAAAAGAGATRQVAVWLEDFQAALAEFVETSTANVTAFLLLHLGPRYEQGAVEAAGGGSMTWTLAHTTALTSLAIDTYEDFLQRAEQAERVSEAFARAVRRAAAQEIPKIAAGGRTAVQVGRKLEERLVGQYGVNTVTYSDGSQVPVRVYTQMAARTKSGVAYNSGSLNEWNQAGVTYVEVFDGAQCGWTTHDDPDKANGTVRSVLDAAGHMLGHPNCRRGFGARPDVTTDAEAKAAEPSTTAEQRADQAAAELRQEEAVRVRAAVVRRARRAALREARATGSTDPETVGSILNRVLRERGIV